MSVSENEVKHFQTPSDLLGFVLFCFALRCFALRVITHHWLQDFV